MAFMDNFAAVSLRVPTIRSADWFIRIPTAAIILEQGYLKFPDLAAQAEAFGIPTFAFFLAAFAELAGGLAILLGGLLRENWMSDLLTRIGGLAIALVVAGVIAMIYFGPFAGWQLQGMLLASGLFFLMRGNGDISRRKLI